MFLVRVYRSISNPAQAPHPKPKPHPNTGASIRRIGFVGMLQHKKKGQYKGILLINV